MHRGETKNCRDTVDPTVATAMSRLLHLGPYLQPFLMDTAIQQQYKSNTSLHSVLPASWMKCPQHKIFQTMIFVNKQIPYI